MGSSPETRSCSPSRIQPALLRAPAFARTCASVPTNHSRVATQTCRDESESQCINLASISDLPRQPQTPPGLKAAKTPPMESETFTLKFQFSTGSNLHIHSAGVGSPPPPSHCFPAPIPLPPFLTAHCKLCPAGINLERLQL